MNSHYTKGIMNNESGSLNGSEDIETYTFSIKSDCNPPLLYCCSLPKFNSVDLAESLKMLETIEVEGKLTQSNSKKKKFEEEAKTNVTTGVTKKLRLDQVKAAVKVALKCKMESGYELIQGFAGNMKSLAMDMGILNTVKHILPKIAFMLVERKRH